MSTFVDFHWLVEYAKNIDGVRISNYMHKDRNAKLKAGPIWDWDLSWGNADYAEGGKTNGWYYPLMGDADDSWLRRLRTDPDFYQKIIAGIRLRTGRAFQWWSLTRSPRSAPGDWPRTGGHPANQAARRVPLILLSWWS